MRVALFVTCLGDVALPRRRPGHRDGARAARPRGRLPGRRRRAAARCTPTPATSTTRCGLVRHHVDVFERALAEGCDAIVAPSGSCVGSVRHQHAAVARRRRRRGPRGPGRGGRRPHLRAVRAARRRARGDRRRRLLPAPRHLPPHLPLAAAARVGDRPLRLLRAVRGIDLVELPAADQCCGFGGTFAVKNADTSTAMLADKMSAVLTTRAEVVTAGDASCLMHIGGGLSRLRDRRAARPPRRDPREHDVRATR